jgi:RNA recognition motif-containing protein
VQNLSEEVEVEAFYEFFAKFGEILQCKTDTDSYGQYFGQVQYMETASVAAAVDGANGTRWHGAVIQVVPHHKAAQAER